VFELDVGVLFEDDCVLDEEILDEGAVLDEGLVLDDVEAQAANVKATSTAKTPKSNFFIINNPSFLYKSIVTRIN